MCTYACDMCHKEFSGECKFPERCQFSCTIGHIPSVFSFVKISNFQDDSLTPCMIKEKNIHKQIN